MVPINKDALTEENLNIKGIVPEHSGINKYDDDKYRQALITTIGNRAKNSMKQLTTDVPQESSHNWTETLMENNKKSQITKMDKHILSTNYVPPYSFYVELKEYYGRVLKIDKTISKFTAELINITNENEMLEAEFDISYIDKGDLGLLRSGALFIWKIGKEENNGTQQRISQIVFRRLSSWRTVDIERTEEIAKSRAAAIRATIAEDSSTGQ